MRTLLGLIAALGLVACVGGIDTPPAGGDPSDGVGGGGTGEAAAEARRLFDANVQPIIAAKCIGCHNVSGPVGNITGFVDPNKDTAYVTATGYQALVGNWTPSGAPILTLVLAGHKSQSYSTDEQTKITDWLAKELESRAGSGGGGGSTETPAQATQRLINEWSGCMTIENFNTANMKAWGNVQAGGSNCRTCHNSGAYGMVADNTDDPFFMIISSDKYYMAQYFSVDLSGGVAAAKVIVNTRSFTGVGEGLAPHQSHPRFDPLNNNGMEALQQFYDLTMQAKAAAPNGVCGPTKLLN
ncbi:MAG TPA: hypothetical protein VFQ53_02920 [Kofleriaceae bacterium]|nr:hypothetical protein [Kofleriaceae bacterium]